MVRMFVKYFNFGQILSLSRFFGSLEGHRLELLVSLGLEMVQLLHVLAERNTVAHHKFLRLAFIHLHVRIFEADTRLDFAQDGLQELEQLELAQQNLLLRRPMGDCQVGAPRQIRLLENLKIFHQLRRVLIREEIMHEIAAKLQDMFLKFKVNRDRNEQMLEEAVAFGAILLLIAVEEAGAEVLQ